MSLGVGLNLVEADFRLFGIPMKGATRRFEEQLAVLQGVWTEAGSRIRASTTAMTTSRSRPAYSRSPTRRSGSGPWRRRRSKRAGRLGLGWVTDPLHNMDVMAAWAEIFRSARA